LFSDIPPENADCVPFFRSGIKGIINLTEKVKELGQNALAAGLRPDQNRDGSASLIQEKFETVSVGILCSVAPSERRLKADCYNRKRQSESGFYEFASMSDYYRAEIIILEGGRSRFNKIKAR
jgi:hypothetical protein